MIRRATNRLGCTLAWALASAVVAAQSPEPLVVQGELPKEARWQGVVRVVGDVTVPDGGRLEILAGTKVLIADQDASKAGRDKGSVEIVVRGQLLVQGSTERPVLVTLESAAADAEKDSTEAIELRLQWHGITLLPSGDAAKNRDHVRGLHLEHAKAGIRIPDGDPLIEDCVFRHCTLGIDIGVVWIQGKFVTTAGCGPAGPEIRRCRFTSGYTGVCACASAVPVVELCVFHKLRNGVSSHRPDLVYYLAEPGPTVSHCIFHQCDQGVVGCSMVRDSVFLGCRRAMALSEDHDRDGEGIDHMVSENCLVHDCQHEIGGDSAVARDVIRGDPMLRGPLDELGKPWPPLPPCLELAAGSAAIGAARDGSDLGPIVGQRRQSAPKLAWTGKLVTGFRAASCDPPGGWQKIAKPSLGAAVGKSWWAAADQEPDGLVGLRRVFGFGRTVGLLAFEFDCAAAGQVPLEFSADAMKLEIAVNGIPVVTAANRQRFGGVNGPVQAKVRAGTNVLLVHAVAWGPEPFLGVALGGDWTPTPPPDAAEAADPPVLKGRLVRLKDGVFLEATLTATSHWTSAPGKDLARVKPAGQLVEAQAVDVLWSGPGRLRIGPLPPDCRKGDVEVTLPGLRDPSGKPLAVEPLTVKVL